jgi:hypothetical protein
MVGWEKWHGRHSEGCKKRFWDNVDREIMMLEEEGDGSE